MRYSSDCCNLPSSVDRRYLGDARELARSVTRPVFTTLPKEAEDIRNNSEQLSGSLKHLQMSISAFTQLVRSVASPLPFQMMEP